MSDTSDRAEVLRDFTKEEIIQWVRENGLFLRVSRRDLLFIRWRMQSQQLSIDYQAELDRWDAEKPDFSQRDALAVKFNSSADHRERLRLLEQIERYDNALKDHLDRWKRLDQRQRKVDLLCRQLDEAT